MPGFGERWRSSAARYASFMSYSHAADGRLAPALQRGIERLGKPWYRRPLIKVFRDETSLSANPGLWSGIQAALEQCEYFLLMCSQKSAASPWVQKEVAWWLANRSASRLLLVITDGEIAWNGQARDFDWPRTNCVPAELSGRFGEEPYYIDLRWAKERGDLSLRNAQFRSAVLTLAATLHGKPMEELDSEDIRQQRSLRMVGLAVLIVLVGLGIVAYTSQRSFRTASKEADSANRIADSRRMAAAASQLIVEHGDLHRAILLGVLAWRLSPTNEAEDVLRQLAKSSSDVARVIGQYSTDGLEVKAFTHAADGSPVLVTADDGTLMRWQIPSGTPVGSVFSVGQKSPWGFRFSTDGTVMLTVDGYPKATDRGGVVVTDLKTMTTKQFPVELLPPAFNFYDLRPGRAALSPSGRFVAVLGGRNQIAVWDTVEGKVSLRAVTLKPYIFGLTLLDDSRVLFIAGVPELGGYLPGNRRVGPLLGLWNTANNQVQLGPSTTVDQDIELDYFALFNSDASRLLVFPQHSEPVLLYSRDGLSLHQLQLPGNLNTESGSLSVFSFNASGSRVAATWDEKTVVWDLEKSAIVKNTMTSSRSALSVDGRWLAANVNRRINVWDLNATGDGTPLASACALDRNDGKECIQLLCEKVSLQIQDSEDLKASLGEFEFDRLKRVALNRPCERN